MAQAMIEITNATITSLQLLDEINFFREQEKLINTNSKNRLLTEKKHDALLKTIREEFEEELGVVEFNDSSGAPILSSYKNKQNKEQPMYILTHDQGKQILLKESKIVRKAVIKKLNAMEKALRDIQFRIGDKKHQLECMELLNGYLPEELKKDKINYIKANIVVNKTVSNFYGFPKLLKKEEMNLPMLETREYILDDYLKLFEVLEDNSEVKEILYNKWKKREAIAQ